MESTFEIRVRFADTDAQGHVFFANYLTFFDEAMSHHLKVAGFPWQRLVEIGCDVVYKDAHITYEGRATFDELLTIRTTTLKVGRTSISFQFVACRGESPIATGELVTVCVDSKEMTKREVPDSLRAALTAPP